MISKSMKRFFIFYLIKQRSKSQLIEHTKNKNELLPEKEKKRKTERKMYNIVSPSTLAETSSNGSSSSTEINQTKAKDSTVLLPSILQIPKEKKKKKRPKLFLTF